MESENIVKLVEEDLAKLEESVKGLNKDIEDKRKKIFKISGELRRKRHALDLYLDVKTHKKKKKDEVKNEN